MMHYLQYSLSLASALIVFYQPARANNIIGKDNFTTFNRSTPPTYHLLDSIEIKGKITDSTGTAIQGVVITEKGTTNNALSEPDGTFSISADPNGILIFLKSGFSSKEIHVNNQNLIETSLSVGKEPSDSVATTAADSSATVSPPAAPVISGGGDTTAAITSAAQDTAAAPTQAGQDMVTGIVSGPAGPLSEVTVTVEGTNVSTSTDQSGKFQLAADANSTLTFSSVGYKTVSQKVGDRANVQVVLAAENNTLESVQVVAVGYGTMERATLPTAVSSIGANQIQDEVLPSITQAIQGKAGGVQVTQKSGSPGGGISIRVRGTTSINASSDPLYVVDGIPVNSTTNFTGGSTFDFGGGTQGINVLSSINPSDVQSVEILKDAASSSIYGSRAANGVVLITTKKGVAGESQFNFNMYEGFSQVPRERYYDFMNTAQYQDYMKDYYKILQEQDPSAVIPDQIFANPNINTDWQDAIFRTAGTRNYELSASGGGEKTQYYTSVGYMKQGGVLLGSDYSRMSGRLNLDHQHNEKLRFSTSINLTRAINQRVQEENSKEGATKSGIFSPPNLTVYDADGNFVYDQVRLTRENPVAMLELPTNEAETFRILANASVEYNIIPELLLKTSFGTDISFIDETFFMPPSGLRSYTGQGGIGARRNTRDQLWINETTLTFDKTFGDHSINALGGFSIQESQLEFVHAQRTNFPNNDIPYITAGGVITGANSYPEEWAIASGFARVNYVYKDKYILNANIRSDGSSRFGADNRWAVFPSFAGAWRLSEEDFLKDSKTVSDLKLRASWGITGNQNIGNYASRSLYSGGNNYMGIAGFIPNVLGDRGLKWETTNQWNVGVDAGFLDDRISLLADYYHKKTTDLLIGLPILTSSGYMNRFTNSGDIENKGFEFELVTRNLVGEFKWTTSLNMTFNRNKVLALPEGIEDMRGGVGDLNRAIEGQPLGVFYGWQAIGVNAETGMIDYLGSDGSAVSPTDYQDHRQIGDPNPEFFGGISNTFQYKNFDLNIDGQFSYGNDIFNYNLASGLEGFNPSGNPFVDFVDRWREPGDITDVPRPAPGDLSNGAVSSRFIEDGSFFRLRNITLGYTLPSTISERIKMKKLRWYVTVQNAYVFTNYRGYDPEVSSSHGGANTGLIYGYDYGSYPQPRIFTTGINMTF
ncbi:SusC/RagA family TonB-linked outer membrane protein [Sphingobacterium shayense]|uniref:SusC/RagA family TonB-linked outer membrane protein n=1 Tax=Sphingobacterium shayense TaxID=626343 RepID=UPI0015517B53|nr:SusC/RagA family TonB-linked outer membrane protein [Sphingobacterium shayense]NQD69283.1 SusC/RagA family TonB-linked outer membrane protein [Sphingobacterium shayense]